jgi:hypothetical protein
MSEERSIDNGVPSQKEKEKKGRTILLRLSSVLPTLLSGLLLHSIGERREIRIAFPYHPLSDRRDLRGKTEECLFLLS